MEDSKTVIMMIFQGKRMAVNSRQRGAHFNAAKLGDVSHLSFLSCFSISAKAENWVISIPLEHVCLIHPSFSSIKELAF